MIEEFGPHDPLAGAFTTLGERLRPGASAELLPLGARCLLARRGSEPVARASWEIAGDLGGAPGLSGILGHYEAVDAEAGVGLLIHARQFLAAQGVARVVGPMNGSTWARYRLALPRSPGDPGFDPPVFFTEPQNPDNYPAQFQAAGFRVAAEYESRIVTDLARERPRAAALARRIAASGIVTRGADLDRFEAELCGLFELSAAAFVDNLYYRPVEYALFRELYLRLRPLLDPELVRLAHDRNGRLLAFLFALPDPLSAAGGSPARVILKTFATAPGARRLGLGTHLADQLHQLAHRKGYGAVIHALMHVANDSVRISHHYQSQLFRRYALYEWTP